MATLAAILDQLADNVRSITDTLSVDVQVEGRMVLSPTPPCIDMYPGDPSTEMDEAGFDDTFGGELITIRTRVNTADHEAGQDLLLSFMDGEDPLSVANALEDDPTVGGLGRITLRSRSGYTLFPVPTRDGEGVLLGFTINAIVVKTPS